MPRIKVTINKANTKRLIDFVKKLKKENPVYGNWEGEENDEFYNKWFSLMKEEIRSIRDCHEKDIIVAYISEALRIAKSIANPTPDSLFYATRKGARTILIRQYTNKSFDNNIDRYFNEVKKQYIEHPQNECDDLVFCDENREIFLKNNLKLVVNCAKRYQNLGLPFEDLIQAGNEGLLIAFDRFDTAKANLRNKIIQSAKDECKEDEYIPYERAEHIIREGFTYGKLLDDTLSKLPKDGFECLEDFLVWIKKNVKTAVFASVAFQWIRSNILIEITKKGSVISIPGKNALSSVVRLDSMNPYTEDCYHDNDISKTANEEFIIEDSKLEEEEKVDTFRDIINNAMKDMNVNERRYLRKRFGIGLPYSMSVSELAENECVSLSTVKLTLKNAMANFANAFTDDQKKLVLEYLNTK